MTNWADGDSGYFDVAQMDYPLDVIDPEAAKRLSDVLPRVSELHDYHFSLPGKELCTRSTICEA